MTSNSPPQPQPLSAALSDAGLTPMQLATCLLAWSERLPQSRIAGVQGISVNAVKFRLRCARQRLRAAGIEPPVARCRIVRIRTRSLSLIENV